MRTYQTLTLIGSIFGILISLGVIASLGILGGTANVFLDMADEFDPGNPDTEERRQEWAEREAEAAPVVGGLWLSFFLFLILIPIVFATKTHTKVVGVLIIFVALITSLSGNWMMIIPFALLLPAGIVALRYKRQEVLGITTTTAAGVTTTTAAGNNNDRGGEGNEGRKGNHKEVVRDSKSGIYYTKD